MDELAVTVANGFISHVERFAQKVHALAEPLSDEQLWRRPYPYGNSFGHLVLHLTGNLSYYIGAQVAKTGYIRARDVEFTDSARPPKADVLRAFDVAVDMVLATIAAQRDGDWTTPYSGVGEPDAHTRFDIFLKCAMHFYHHVGQMVYLDKARL